MVIITFKTAKLAKDKGFNLNSQAFYGCDDPVSGESNKLILRDWEKWINFGKEDSTQDGTAIYSAPTQSLLQKWLREVHGIHIVIIPTVTSYWTYKTLTVLSERDNDIIKGIKSVSDLPPYDNVCGEDFSTYELALEDALQKSLILIN